jgi:hypothetical protein
VNVGGGILDLKYELEEQQWAFSAGSVAHTHYIV